MRRRSGDKKIPMIVLAVFCAAVIKSGRGTELITGTAAVSAAVFSPDAALDAVRRDYSDKVSAGEVPLSEEEEKHPVRVTPAKEPSSAAEKNPKKETESELPSSLDIPEEYRGTVLSEDFSGYEGGPAFSWKRAWIRNYTDLSQEEILGILSSPTPIRSDESGEPQVLIYHTHATESYCPGDEGAYDLRYNWRSTDVGDNMVAVGKVMTETLRSRGIEVIHDTYLHDYPSYNGSYASSFASIEKYLEKYPTIKVVLDVHRDAIERSEGLIVKPVITYEGEKYAQVMVISNCDDGSGLIPEWRENLKFAAAFTDAMENLVPSITRPILFSHRKYNQQLSTGALLLEFGSHANTLEEAKRSAKVVGNALADLLLSALTEEQP